MYKHIPKIVLEHLKSVESNVQLHNALHCVLSDASHYNVEREERQACSMHTLINDCVENFADEFSYLIASDTEIHDYLHEYCDNYVPVYHSQLLAYASNDLDLMELDNGMEFDNIYSVIMFNIHEQLMQACGEWLRERSSELLENYEYLENKHEIYRQKLEDLTCGDTTELHHAALDDIYERIDRVEENTYRIDCMIDKLRDLV